jgi:hypothetical protein
MKNIRHFAVGLLVLVLLSTSTFAADRVGHCYTAHHPDSMVAFVYRFAHPEIIQAPCPTLQCTCSFWSCLFGPAKCWTCGAS